MARKICEIAHEILKVWKPIQRDAQPYIEAMLYLEEITDMYGQDSADDIVLRFLSNATHWRGEDARRIKAELKDLLK